MSRHLFPLECSIALFSRAALLASFSVLISFSTAFAVVRIYNHRNEPIQIYYWGYRETDWTFNGMQASNSVEMYPAWDKFRIKDDNGKILYEFNAPEQEEVHIVYSPHEKPAVSVEKSEPAPPARVAQPAPVSTGAVLSIAIVVTGVALLIRGIAKRRSSAVRSYSSSAAESGSSYSYSDYTSGGGDQGGGSSNSSKGSTSVEENFGSIGRGSVTKIESGWPSKPSASIHERSSGIGPGVDHHGTVAKSDRQGPTEIQTGHGLGKETWVRQKDGSFERKK